MCWGYDERPHSRSDPDHGLASGRPFLLTGGRSARSDRTPGRHLAGGAHRAGDRLQRRVAPAHPRSGVPPPPPRIRLPGGGSGRRRGTGSLLREELPVQLARCTGPVRAAAGLAPAPHHRGGVRLFIAADGGRQPAFPGWALRHHLHRALSSAVPDPGHPRPAASHPGEGAAGSALRVHRPVGRGRPLHRLVARGQDRERRELPVLRGATAAAAGGAGPRARHLPAPRLPKGLGHHGEPQLERAVPAARPADALHGVPPGLWQRLRPPPVPAVGGGSFWMERCP
jgi:hypothetical protein